MLGFRDCRPPASLVLVHGAGSGPWVFEGWEQRLRAIEVAAVDLQEGLDVARASMDDYAAVVAAEARRRPSPVAVCGWSMGGLVALQAAAQLRLHSVVLIEASPPGEIQGFDPEVELVEGVFDPESTYGRFPTGMLARPESLLARAERKRGVSVPSLDCPSLVVYGDTFPQERGRMLAEHYASEELAVSGLGHWDLLRDPGVHRAIAAYLGLPGARAKEAPGAVSGDGPIATG